MTLLRIGAVILNLAVLGAIGSAGQPFQNRDKTADPHRSKPRIVITTAPELDDSNSLVRWTPVQEKGSWSGEASPRRQRRICASRPMPHAERLDRPQLM